MNWDQDPELKAMRDEFVASLSEREEALARALERSDWRAVQEIAHKLAGVAATYGLPTLTTIGENLDDLLEALLDDASSRGCSALSATRLKRYSNLLKEALTQAKGGRDPEGFLEDERMASLISDVESLLSGSTNGSS